MPILSDHGLKLHDLDKAFYKAMSFYNIPVPHGIMNKIQNTIYEYDVLQSDGSYIRKYGTTVAICAMFEDLSEITAIKFLTKQVEPIFRNYKVLGCLKPMFRIDCAVVDITRKYILCMYLNFNADDSDYLKLHSRYVIDKGAAPYHVSKEEIDEFLFNEQFDADLEKILEKD